MILFIFATLLHYFNSNMRFILTILLIFVFQMMNAQNVKLNSFLNEVQPGIKDTLFQINALDGNSVDIPTTIIKGNQKGPTFTIIAGIHGMEYPTIMSLLDLRKEIDVQKLKGNLIIIPIVNVQSFYQRVPFVNPLDQLNLNRVFPGNNNGSITEVIAAFLTEQVFEITDILLDMHGGDVGEDLIPFVCYYDNQEFKNQTELAKKLSEISGFETVVSYPYILPKEKPAMYAFKQAVRDGKTALSIEIGRLGNWNNEEITLTKDAIYRMMNELDMYKNEHITQGKKVKARYNQQKYISVPVQGIFYSNLKAGDYVEKNQEIGYITDLFGNKIETIIAPESGIILYKIGTPPVNKGETLFCIGLE